VGIWINEEDPNLIWEFKGSGQLIEKYGKVEKTSSSNYQILDSSQSCSSGSTDKPDEIYLKITGAELGSFCYYLETLSEDVLVIFDSDSGRMLIFNREN
jgi:hypothetical protein